MCSKQAVRGDSTVRVRNVGGIDETAVTFSPGVTILRGRNATNRTSLLQAVMAGLGGSSASLKGDADEGRVELDLNGETYTRTLRREGGSVRFDGDPYLDGEEAETAEVFAFLLEDNEGRRAVARGDDLHDIIMRPVDTAEIEAEIDRLEREKRALTRELAELDDLEAERETLERERAALRREREATREALAEKEAEVDAADADGEPASLESTLTDLGEVRAALENTRLDLDSERESVDALERERADLRADLDALPAATDETEDLEARLEHLRARRRSLDGTVSELQSIVQFNREMLEGSAPDVADALAADAAADATDGAVTDRLLDGETTTCWTCGSDVDVDQIATTVDRLQSLRRTKLAERNEIRERQATVKATLDEHRTERDRRARARTRLERVVDELERRRERIETLERRREERTARIERLEAEVEAREHDDHAAVLALHREANELEFELGRLDDDVDEVGERIARIDGRLAERADLERERETVTESLTDLRTRVDRLETEAVERFNDRMATVLDLLEYENLDRIWLERSVDEDRSSVDDATFELHVVRTTASGTAYEDTVDHLSESEREVTGLVFALAGYLVHEVPTASPTSSTTSPRRRRSSSRRSCPRTPGRSTTRTTASTTSEPCRRRASSDTEAPRHLPSGPFPRGTGRRGTPSERAELRAVADDALALVDASDDGLDAVAAAVFVGVAVGEHRRDARPLVEFDEHRADGPLRVEQAGELRRRAVLDDRVGDDFPRALGFDLLEGVDGRALDARAVGRERVGAALGTPAEDEAVAAVEALPPRRDAEVRPHQRSPPSERTRPRFRRYSA